MFRPVLTGYKYFVVRFDLNRADLQTYQKNFQITFTIKSVFDLRRH